MKGPEAQCEARLRADPGLLAVVQGRMKSHHQSQDAQSLKHVLVADVVLAHDRTGLGDEGSADDAFPQGRSPNERRVFPKLFEAS